MKLKQIKASTRLYGQCKCNGLEVLKAHVANTSK